MICILILFIVEAFAISHNNPIRKSKHYESYEWDKGGDAVHEDYGITKFWWEDFESVSNTAPWWSSMNISIAGSGKEPASLSNMTSEVTSTTELDPLTNITLPSQILEQLRRNPEYLLQMVEVVTRKLFAIDTPELRARVYTWIMELIQKSEISTLPSWVLSLPPPSTKTIFDLTSKYTGDPYATLRQGKDHVTRPWFLRNMNGQGIQQHIPGFNKPPGINKPIISGPGGLKGILPPEYPGAPPRNRIPPGFNDGIPPEYHQIPPGFKGNVPEFNQGVPPGFRQLPTGYEGFLPGSKEFPSGFPGFAPQRVKPELRKFPASQEPPIKPAVSRAGSERIPPDSQGFWPDSPETPLGSQGFSPDSPGIPPDSQGFPPDSQEAPSGFLGFSPGSPGFSTVTPKFPPEPQDELGFPDLPPGFLGRYPDLQGFPPRMNLSTHHLPKPHNSKNPDSDFPQSMGAYGVEGVPKSPRQGPGAQSEPRFQGGLQGNPGVPYSPREDQPPQWDARFQGSPQDPHNLGPSGPGVGNPGPGMDPHFGQFPPGEFPGFPNSPREGPPPQWDERFQGGPQAPNKLGPSGPGVGNPGPGIDPHFGQFPPGEFPGFPNSPREGPPPQWDERFQGGPQAPNKLGPTGPGVEGNPGPGMDPHFGQFPPGEPPGRQLQETTTPSPTNPTPITLTPVPTILTPVPPTLTIPTPEMTVQTTHDPLYTTSPPPTTAAGRQLIPGPDYADYGLETPDELGLFKDLRPTLAPIPDASIIFEDVTWPTTITMHPLIDGLKKEMGSKSVGFFTVFVTKFMELLATKERDDAERIIIGANEALNELDRQGFVRGMGTPLWPATMKGSEIIRSVPPEITQSQAGVAFQMLQQKDIALAADMNDIINMLDMVYMRTEGGALLASLVDLDEYPANNQSAVTIMRSMFSAVLEPYIRLKGTDRMNLLLDKINVAIEDRYGGNFRRRKISVHQTTTVDESDDIDKAIDPSRNSNSNFRGIERSRIRFSNHKAKVDSKKSRNSYNKDKNIANERTVQKVRDKGSRIGNDNFGDDIERSRIRFSNHKAKVDSKKSRNSYNKDKNIANERTVQKVRDKGSRIGNDNFGDDIERSRSIFSNHKAKVDSKESRNSYNKDKTMANERIEQKIRDKGSRIGNDNFGGDIERSRSIFSNHKAKVDSKESRNSYKKDKTMANERTEQKITDKGSRIGNDNFTDNIERSRIKNSKIRAKAVLKESNNNYRHGKTIAYKRNKNKDGSTHKIKDESHKLRSGTFETTSKIIRNKYDKHSDRKEIESKHNREGLEEFWNKKKMKDKSNIKGLAIETDRDFTFDKNKEAHDKKHAKHILKKHLKTKHHELYENLRNKHRQAKERKRRKNKSKGSDRHGHNYEKLLKERLQEDAKLDIIKAKAIKGRKNGFKRSTKFTNRSHIVLQKRFSVVDTFNRNISRMDFEMNTEVSKQGKRVASEENNTKKSQYITKLITDSSIIFKRFDEKEDLNKKADIKMRSKKGVVKDSTSSDEEGDLKFMLQDTIRHGDRIFAERRNIETSNRMDINVMSSYSDEEGVLKKNIYKVFGYNERHIRSKASR